MVAKAIGSNNPYNMVNATIAALQKMQNPRQVANRRGKKVADIVAARELEPGDSESSETTESKE